MKNTRKIAALGLCVTLLAGAAVAETISTSGDQSSLLPAVSGQTLQMPGITGDQNQFSGAFDGQMPSGVPVATVACGSAGPVNAALLAVQILGTADEGLRAKFHAHKDELRRKVAAADDRIHE